MHRVAEGFADLFADVFAEADDITRCPHLHYLAVVGYPVECGVYRQTAFAEESLDVERHLHISGIHIPALQYDCVKLEGLLYHNDVLTVCNLFQ